MPTWALQGLPESIRKTKRKGLRVAKDGLRAQRLERFREQRKKYAELEAEELDRGKEEKKKSKGKTLKATNESSFKSPAKATQRSLMNSSIASSGNRGGDLFNSSASQILPNELSPGMQQQFTMMTDQLQNTSLTAEMIPTATQSKKRKFGEVSAQGN